ncbi:MAG: flagellar basal body rod protein FlgC [endosymbiont of Galathealinum brachiosum]|uniref:Flagellar basal-body rod protein FlgC n=1 Tax=endosymbiont of Galathealinum brachiosum TaxID=2200906 RepID=A0A370DK07_9GAMM|nr:MAG: flagellar basal body rod protein FlgC [endosymbiont of Galathealinum brachiosum]
MSVFNVFDVAGSGMSAQMLRLNAVSSNLANAETISGNEADVYQARHPVFESVLQEAKNMNGNNDVALVKVREIMQEDTTAVPHFRPNHPLANDDGFVYSPNIDAVAEMADMISASRSYQNNVEVLSTTKELILRTLQLGQG